MRLRESVPSPNDTSALPAALRSWLEYAVEQMRWKRARPAAARELADHLTDQYEAFCAEGMDEAAAAQATLREMGDAVETGTQLDRAWRPKPDWVMLSIVLVMALLGKAMQCIIGMEMDGEQMIRMDSQVFGYIIGVLLLLAGYFADYTLIGRYIKVVYAVWLIGGILLYRLTPMTQGRIIYLAQWTWFFPVLFAGVLYSQRGKGSTGIDICLLAMVPMWVLAYAAPQMSAVAVMTVVCCAVLSVSTRRGVFGVPDAKKTILSISPLLLAFAAFVCIVLQDPHIRERLPLVLHPQLDDYGTGWLGSIMQSVMFGVPCAWSSEDWSGFFKLEGVTDYMIAGSKYLFGWAPALALIAVSVLFLAWGFRLAAKQRGVLARSVCFGVMGTFTGQTLLYVMQNCGLILIGAYGLPLLSYGNTYFCQTMLLLGVLLSAQRNGQIERG